MFLEACAAVMERTAALLASMHALQVPIDVTDSGSLPGMLVLVAHNDATLRRLVANSIIGKLDQIQTSEQLHDEHGQWRLLINDWVRTSCEPEELI
jgi:hypothetical protein